MVGIKEVPIRASIKIGNVTIKTPYILSFNVHKHRGEATTFDASIKIDKKSAKNIGVRCRLSISAGSRKERKIFTGYIKSAKINPCWDDPGYAILALSGADRLSSIKGGGAPHVDRKRDSKFIYCEITGVICKGEKSDENVGDGYSEKKLWFDHGALNKDLASYSTNVDVRSVGGIGEVVSSDKARDPVYLQVELITK